ncbi:hypothetical protein GGS23DRAFT_611026 [Durotheca rogersii]|uniref:uncharacterized protein n=1 Tax=Durotheca rogersii TaxID=419775 RepID=UPI00221F57E4|nr:uncharacterized protein GGS23DRAFT_611026 [Durotheca rogersii]KAI5861902.1 hypothetical protein GGS23DRAFT_611026 [Durotheca rogersii]
MAAEDAAAPRITVFRGWDAAGAHVWSPYVVKLEARLRFAGVPYTVSGGSLRAAPRGKIPYVEFRAEGSSAPAQRLGDSALIARALVDRGVLPDLAAPLPPPRRALDLALRALLEDKLYFYHTWERWFGNYYAMRDHVLAAVPYPVRVVVGYLVYRTVTATLRGQGTLRFAPEEITAFRREIWDGFSALLLASRSESARGAAEPFWVLGGDQPTDADTTLFGFVVSVLVCTACPDSQEVVKSFPVLLDYASRIHDRYFPDYEKWTV